MPRNTTSSRRRPRTVRFTIARRENDREMQRIRLRRNGEYRKLQKGQHLHNCANWIHLYNNFNPTRTFMQRKITLWDCAKEDYPNDIILMKVGAFIEVFNEDADVFHTEFEFPYMKGGIAWTAFPFSRFNIYVANLQSQNYTWHMVTYDVNN